MKGRNRDNKKTEKKEFFIIRYNISLQSFPLFYGHVYFKSYYYSGTLLQP